MMLTVLFNHTIMGMSCYIVMFQILKFWGLPNIRELPPLSTLLRDIFVAVIFEEIGFYYSHLTLHHKYLYKTVHKKHHEWSAPVALATYHCHPLEHILSNFLPPHLGMILMGSHFVTFLIVMVGVLVGSLTLHSGFHFPYFPSSQAHDYHHLK